MMRLKKKVRAYFEHQVQSQKLPIAINTVYNSVSTPVGEIPGRRKLFIQGFVFNTALVVCLVFLLMMNANIFESLQNTAPFHYELREVEKSIAKSLERFHTLIKQAHLNFNTK